MLNPSKMDPIKAREFSSTAELRAARNALKLKFLTLPYKPSPPKPEVIIRDRRPKVVVKPKPVAPKPVHYVNPFVGIRAYTKSLNAPTKIRPGASTETIEHVVELVAETFDIPEVLLLGRTGKKNILRISHIRFIMMSICISVFKLKYLRVANYFDVNHASVYHAVWAMQPILMHTESIADQHDRIKKIIEIASIGVGVHRVDWNSVIKVYEGQQCFVAQNV